MSLDADTIVDRRRMRRKLTLWRVLAVLLAIATIAAVSVAMRVPGSGVLSATGGSIARGRPGKAARLPQKSRMSTTGAGASC